MKNLILIFLFIIPLFLDKRLEGNTDLARWFLLNIFIASSLCLWLKTLFKENKIKIVHTPLNIFIFFYLVVSIIATCKSYQPALSIFGTYFRYEGLLTCTAYIIFFHIIINFTDERTICKYKYIIISTATLLALHAISQYYRFDPLRWEVWVGGRVGSVLGNPVFLACYIMMSIPFALALFILAKNYFIRLISIICIALLTISFFLANTKACFIGLFFALLIFFAGLYKEVFRIKFHFLMLIIALLPIIGFYSLNPKTSPIERFVADLFPSGEEKKEDTGSIQSTTTPSLQDKEKIPAATSTFLRIHMWLSALRIIKDEFIIGIGPEVMDIVFPYYQTEEYCRATCGRYLRADRAHNEILDVTVTRGILGLIAYYGIIICFFIISWKIYFRVKNVVEKKVILCASVASALGYIIQNQFSFGAIPINILFWLLLGMTMVIKKPQLDSFPSRVVIYQSKFFKVLFCCAAISITSIFLVISGLAYLADLRYHTGKNIEVLKEAIRLNPYERRYWSKVIEEHYNRGEILEAIKYTKGVINLFPKDSIYYNVLGALYERVGDYNSAKYAYQEAVKRAPYFIDAHRNLAYLYKKEKNYKLAIEKFLLLRRYLPQQPEFLYNLSDLYMLAKDENKAAACLEELLNTFPEFFINNNLSEVLLSIYYNAKKMDKVIAVANKVLEYKPEDVTLRLKLAKLYYILGDYNKARQEFEEVLKYQDNKEARAFLKNLTISK